MLFRKDRRNASPDSQRIYAIFEVAYTIIDFMAAFILVIGYVIFIFDDWVHTVN